MVNILEKQMKISVYTKFGPINSKKVFDAFIESLKNDGDEVQLNEDKNSDVAVIWSVLWQGRMLGYQKIWNECQNKNKPVVVLEVGGIKRNETFKHEHWWKEKNKKTKKKKEKT